jgi:hypothetical protein
MISITALEGMKREGGRGRNGEDERHEREGLSRREDKV